MGGAHIVPPYDDAAVIAGQGTIALELLQVAIVSIAIVSLSIEGIARAPHHRAGTTAGAADARLTLSPTLILTLTSNPNPTPHPTTAGATAARQTLLLTTYYYLLQELPQLDAILVPVSGGGMLSGIAVAAKALKPTIRVIAVEPEGEPLGPNPNPDPNPNHNPDPNP